MGKIEYFMNDITDIQCPPLAIVQSYDEKEELYFSQITVEDEQPGVTSPLSREEAEQLKVLESDIDEGLEQWKQVGFALQKIMTGKLYRAQYTTFEEYCKQRHHISKSQGYRLVQSFVTDELFAKQPANTVIKPANECQARLLNGLTEEEKLQIGKAAKELVDKGADPSVAFRAAARNKSDSASNHQSPNKKEGKVNKPAKDKVAKTPSDIPQNITALPSTPTAATLGIISPAAFHPTIRLKSLKDLEADAFTLSTILSNPQKANEAVKRCALLKLHLGYYAEWETSQLMPQQLKEAA